MITIKKLLYGGLLMLLALLPIHTVITVWLTSRFGHLYVWSGWKEALLLIMSLGGGILLVMDRKLRQQLAQPLYNRLSLAYVGLCGIYAVIQGLPSSALVGLALNTRFIVAFWIAQIIAFYFPKKFANVQRLIIGSAAGVALFGVLQVTILDPTILTHVGYDPIGVNTSGIPPSIQKVAADSSLFRAQSSLRGPNVLGAYLILPIILTIYAYLSTRNKKLIALLALFLVALLLSHSRSAILGLLVGLIVWFGIRFDLIKILKKHCFVVAGLVVLGAVVTAMVWYTPAFQTVILHNDPNVATTQSNKGHWLQTIQAVKYLFKHPLGGGIGSAGPSSALIEGQNTRIAENYFLQVGQELGWLGFALFLILQFSVVVASWRKRSNRLIQAVMAAFIGVTFTNLLLHTWSDEVVSILVWSLLGYALVGVTGKLKQIDN